HIVIQPSCDSRVTGGAPGGRTLLTLCGILCGTLQRPTLLIVDQLGCLGEAVEVGGIGVVEVSDRGRVAELGVEYRLRYLTHEERAQRRAPQVRALLFEQCDPGRLGHAHVELPAHLTSRPDDLRSAVARWSPEAESCRCW